MSAKFSLGLILAITLYRVLLLKFDGTDLFVDEAQYWLWSQHLDFGYYSKPPMIAWVIHAATAIGGSDDIFWIRVAGPIFHMITALVLMAAAHRFSDDATVGRWVGVTYATLPGVALSSVFISTDTMLFLFYATALFAIFGLARQRSAALALLLGLAIGLGLLSKYAMIYFVLTAGLAAIFIPGARIAWRDAGIAAMTALFVIAPNLWWNAQHDNVTLKHTTENAGWTGFHLNLDKAAEFLGAQFGVVGPVIFAAMLWALIRAIRNRDTVNERWLALLSWPIIGVIVVQALMSKAYANWAAMAYAAGVILAVMLLLRHNPKMLRISLVINLFVAIALPLVAVFATEAKLPDGEPILKRYLGRAALSRDLASLADGAGVTVIVADNRDVLADLVHTLRDRPLSIRARPHGGFPRHYYEQELSFSQADPAAGVLLVTFGTDARCAQGSAQLLRSWTPADGVYKGRTLSAFRADRACVLAPVLPG